jgi:hypothetical protein
MLEALDYGDYNSLSSNGFISLPQKTLTISFKSIVPDIDVLAAVHDKIRKHINNYNGKNNLLTIEIAPSHITQAGHISYSNFTFKIMILNQEIKIKKFIEDFKKFIFELQEIELSSNNKPLDTTLSLNNYVAYQSFNDYTFYPEIKADSKKYAISDIQEEELMFVNISSAIEEYVESKKVDEILL